MGGWRLWEAPPACWKPKLAPIGGGYWGWKVCTEGGLGCGGNGGCRGICENPGVCNGWCAWLEAVGIWVGWSGCEDEWTEGGGICGSCDDCGTDAGATWGVRCPLGCCGICNECAAVGWDWWLVAGTAAYETGTEGWFWCFLGGIWVWDTPAWSCMPPCAGNIGAGWTLGLCVGCTDCWLFWGAIGWTFGT